MSPGFEVAFFLGLAGAVLLLADFVVAEVRGEGRRFVGPFVSDSAGVSTGAGVSPSGFFADAARLGLAGALPEAVVFLVAGFFDAFRVVRFPDAVFVEAFS